MARPGPKGGIFVATPRSDRVAHSLGIVLSASRVSIAELLEARVELEAAAGGMAAGRATAEDMAELSRSLARFEQVLAAGDASLQVEENLTFHERLVQASHNTVLVALHEALHALIQVSTRQPVYSVSAASDVLQAHRRIVAALAEGDGEAAMRRIRRHLAAFTAYLHASGQEDLLRQQFTLTGGG